MSETAAYDGAVWDSGAVNAYSDSAPSSIEYENNAQDLDTSTTTLTYALDAGTNDNRAVLVAVSSWDGGSEPDAPTGVTYDSVAMALLGITVYGNSKASFYGLTGASSGSNNVVVTWPSTQDDLVSAAVALSGVDSFGTATVEQVDDDVISNDITSETDDVVIDAFFWYNASQTAGANQTERVLNDNGVNYDSMAISTAPGETTTTMDWDVVDPINIAQVALNMNVAAGAPGWVTGALKAYNGATWE